MHSISPRDSHWNHQKHYNGVTNLISEEAKTFLHLGKSNQTEL